jgi:hypothetical protein
MGGTNIVTLLTQSFDRSSSVCYVLYIHTYIHTYIQSVVPLLPSTVSKETNQIVWLSSIISNKVLVSHMFVDLRRYSRVMGDAHR